MRKIRKHALAESDLIGIWQYTFEQWDAAQADKYLDELDDGIQQLADNPEMGARYGRVGDFCSGRRSCSIPSDVLPPRIGQFIS